MHYYASTKSPQKFNGEWFLSYLNYLPSFFHPSVVMPYTSPFLPYSSSTPFVHPIVSPHSFPFLLSPVLLFNSNISVNIQARYKRT
jgi:hypothetical protein